MHTRRSFLRCATGATLALPFLESLHGATPAPPAQRLAIFYVAIGVVRRNFYPGEQDLGLVNFTDKEVGLFSEGIGKLIGARDVDPPFVMMSQGTSGDLQWRDYSQPREQSAPSCSRKDGAMTLYHAMLTKGEPKWSIHCGALTYHHENRTASLPDSAARVLGASLWSCAKRRIPPD